MTDIMAPNAPELVAIYRHIKAHPKEWNQKVYASRSTLCGTAYCVAGHAIVRAGIEIDWSPHFYWGEIGYADNIDDDIDGTSELAQEILGLDEEQAYQLFDADNSLDDIRRIVTEIVGFDPEDDEALALAGVTS